MALHSARFPNESKQYRESRDALLKAEIELRRQTEAVAALRRKLPLGGEVPEDYVFEELVNGNVKSVRLSELFAPGKDTLMVYSYMYGPQMKQPCPMCTSLIDGYDATIRNLSQRVNFAVVARSPIDRIRRFADERGWKDVRLLSSAGNDYNRDYHGEDENGGQMPVMNVFTRREGKVFHTYATELLFVKPEPGEDPRHADMVWPLWNLLDMTPEGRGKDWYPKLNY